MLLLIGVMRPMMLLLKNIFQDIWLQKGRKMFVNKKIVCKHDFNAITNKTTKEKEQTVIRKKSTFQKFFCKIYADLYMIKCTKCLFFLI